MIYNLMDVINASMIVMNIVLNVLKEYVSNAKKDLYLRKMNVSLLVEMEF